MKRIYVSTVGRGKQLEESSKVYCIDFDTGQIINSVRLPLAMFDLTNPRGGCRGCRGLVFDPQPRANGELQFLYAAGFDGIFKINPKTMHIEQGWWSSQCQDIHQIYPFYHGDGRIVITNTMHNEIWCFDPHNQFVPHKDLNKFNHLGKAPPTEGHPDYLHLNSCIWTQDESLALICRTGKILDFNTGEVVTDQPEYLEGSHDLVRINSGEICVNNSKKHRVVAFDKDWNPRVLHQLGEGPRSLLAAYGWVRGMSYIPQKDMLLCGTAPAEVLVLSNVSTNNISIRKIPISDEIVECVFDVIPHYEDWNE